jgi:hypothetical protein
MLTPKDQNGNAFPWVRDPKYEGLLYFVQLIHDMLYYGAPESFRVVSLDSFHRLTEIEKAWDETNAAGLPLGAMTPMIDELLSYAARDPIVVDTYGSQWTAAQPRLHSFSSRPVETLEAIRFLRSNLSAGYLRACRDYIVKFVNSKKLKNRRDFRFVSENFCSYLLNSGHQPHAIYFRVQSNFFERQITRPPEREVAEFFQNFPCRAEKFNVVLAVNEAFIPILEPRPELQSLGQKLPQQCTIKTPFYHNPQRNLFLFQIEALDHVDARVKGEQQLTTLRAVAYTATPAATLEWDPHILVWKSNESRAVILREGVEVLRRARRRSPRPATALGRRHKFFLDDFSAETDRNRVVNSVTTYASAFHSESAPTQLLSLWSSLEGLLPSPDGQMPRVTSFARDVVACHKHLYLLNRFEALYHQLLVEYGDQINEILQLIKGMSSSYESKLAALICLLENKKSLDQLGSICSSNPLARQRLFEIYSACSTCGDLYELVKNHSQKVEWQLSRIYWERNRIVHRASPSPNVEVLILSLNAYITTVIEAVVANGVTGPALSLDQIFANIRINEEARERAVSSVNKVKIDPSNLHLATGRL